MSSIHRFPPEHLDALKRGRAIPLADRILDGLKGELANLSSFTLQVRLT